MKGILLSAVWQDRSVILKFYHPESNKLILVRNNYKPYCFVSDTTAEQIKEFPGIVLQDSVKFDVIKDTLVNLKKVSGINLYGKDDGLASKYQTWESDMKVYQSYLYDNNYLVGKWYDIKTLEPISYSTEISLKVNTDGIIDQKKFSRTVEKWATLLDEPIPQIRRVAFDIEVETTNGMPDPTVADQRVTAISFESLDLHKVFVLERPEIPMGTEPYPSGSVIEWYKSEKEMLESAFAIIESYPVVLTYNGDMFDMPYLYNRAIQLGIANIPFKMMSKNATLNLGIHIDMYGVFHNRSLKLYAFKNKYVEDSLDSVSQAILGENKVKYEGDLQSIPLLTLARYCYNDSRLTYKLSSYNDNMVMNLLIILSRISNMPIDDVSRVAISNWIKSLLYFTHRQNNELIPRSDDFPKIEASTKADIEGKKYQGAIVLEPQTGIHFDVKVLDFASLYPSIIKTKNISYETVCCSHSECKSNKIPQTSHWVCTKKTGIISMLIGSLKELRVNHFKLLSKKAQDKETKERYETISEALKVFLNASYGVIGFESFPLYFLPTAEAVTAYGREIISDTVKTAKEFEMNVIYGDTDSIFIKSPTTLQINKLISYAKQAFNIDLEQDKEYRYVVLSNRRKNYFGIKSDGSADIKGLSGKKSNTPPFIRELFNNIMGDLKAINTIEDFTIAKQSISMMIKERVDNFDSIPLDQLSFKILINKEPSEYKVIPQVLKAAKMLGIEPKKGQFIEYVKTWNEPGVKPIRMVERKEIDKPKYLESLQATLSQICEPMDIDVEAFVTGFKKTKIEDFW